MAETRQMMDETRRMVELSVQMVNQAKETDVNTIATLERLQRVREILDVRRNQRQLRSGTRIE